MELGFAFLAEFADATSGARLHAFSIDFNTLNCPSFPAALPLSLVAKVLGDDCDLGPHRLTFMMCRPDGSVVGEEGHLDFQLQPAVAPLRAAAILMLKIQFAVDTEGLFQFVLDLDGKEVKTLPLLVRLVPDAEAPLVIG